MRLFLVVIMILILLLGRSCAIKVHQSHLYRTEGKTMGTYYRVLIANASARALLGLADEIEHQLAEDNRQISTWQVDTVLSRFNHYKGNKPQPLTKSIAYILYTALRIGQKTGGAMDITIGPLVNLWGFGPEDQPFKTPEDVKIKDVQTHVGLKNIRLIKTKNGVVAVKNAFTYLDLSTVGEGYAVDHLASLVEKRGITCYLVSVGGAVFTKGVVSNKRSWYVAVQHPTDEITSVDVIVDLRGHGISTSGSYRNYYEIDGKRISHIINPKTGRPIDHKLVSATVIAKTALEADSWDTGLMVLGKEKAKALALRESLAVFLVTKDGNNKFTTWMSPQFSNFVIFKVNNNLSY